MFVIMILDIFMYPLRHQKKRKERPNQFFLLLYYFFHVYLLTLFVLPPRFFVSLFFLLPCTYFFSNYCNTIFLPPSFSLSLITAHLTLSLNRSSDIYVYIHDIIGDRFLFLFSSFYSTVLANELLVINIGSMNVLFSNRRKCLS